MHLCFTVLNIFNLLKFLQSAITITILWDLETVILHRTQPYILMAFIRIKMCVYYDFQY